MASPLEEGVESPLEAHSGTQTSPLKSSLPRRVQPAKPRTTEEAIAQQNRWITPVRFDRTDVRWQWKNEPVYSCSPSDLMASNNDCDSKEDNSEHQSSSGVASNAKADDNSEEDSNSEKSGDFEDEESEDADEMTGGPLCQQVQDMIDDCVRLGQLPASYQKLSVVLFR
ncbi:hypothetical protein PG985_009271 [Apiospora marii]|uniref:Uncharacterized protein n=1 Tax=Apiospora marii TaxID=335849 RepID=A0ABR1RAD9_9PEZI